MKYLLFTMMMLSVLNANGQFSYGFRAGLSYSKLVGDHETDDAGNTLDDYRFASGFHIGLSVNYAVTDLFGFRGELVFTQRGTQYRYEGDSYYFLERRTTKERVLPGKRIMDYNVSMASFEVPLMSYFKIGSLEISGGVNAAVIMSSSGGGSLTFEGVAPSGKAVDPFKVILQYNFNKDNAQEASLPDLPVKVDGVTLLTPHTVGAYYDFDEKHGNAFKAIDFGLVGGLAYYLNEGLYLSGRVSYGLLDADDNQYDISYYKLGPGNSYIQRSDKNQHLTMQMSIGFLF